MSYARVWDELNALNRLRLVTLSLRRYTPMNIINLIGSQIKCKCYKLLSVKKNLYISCTVSFCLWVGQCFTWKNMCRSSPYSPFGGCIRRPLLINHYAFGLRSEFRQWIKSNLRHRWFSQHNFIQLYLNQLWISMLCPVYLMIFPVYQSWCVVR